MNDIELTYREVYLYVIIVGAVLGALFGLAPLILGRRRNKSRLGVYGFLASIVGGAVAPLLGLVVAAIFSWLVVRNNSAPADAAAGTEPDRTTDTPAE